MERQPYSPPARRSPLVRLHTKVLSEGIYDPATLASDFVGASGTSPVIMTTNGTTIAHYLGNATSMTERVFPSGSDAQPVTPIVQQDFIIYNTQFHGFKPHDGWQFNKDGECDSPAQCG